MNVPTGLGAPVTNDPSIFLVTTISSVTIWTSVSYMGAAIASLTSKEDAKMARVFMLKECIVVSFLICSDCVMYPSMIS